MLRWLIIGLLFYGITIGLKDGWLTVKWNNLLNEVGLTRSEVDKVMHFSEFILDRFHSLR